jgi:hypothetical protein
MTAMLTLLVPINQALSLALAIPDTMEMEQVVKMLTNAPMVRIPVILTQFVLMKTAHIHALVSTDIWEMASIALILTSALQTPMTVIFLPIVQTLKAASFARVKRDTNSILITSHVLTPMSA